MSSPLSRSGPPRRSRRGALIDRVRERFGIHPERLVGDTGYGSAEMLGWLVEERGIAPHIHVWDKSKRTDGTFSRDDFAYDPTSDTYTCPGGKTLQPYRRNFSQPRTPKGDQDGLIRYRATKQDCGSCALRARCCPNQPARKSSAPFTKPPSRPRSRAGNP